MFDSFPNLNALIYSLNIDVIEGNPDNTSGDDRVGLTVFEVINLFFQHEKNVAVYVCDSAYQRQLARKRKFDLWFFMYNNGNIIKEDGVVVIEETEIYNTMLIHKLNEQVNEIIEAFKFLNQSNSGK